MVRTEYGIQMYSLRDITEKDMYGALKNVAEMGYKYIEFAGFFDYTAEQIKAWLDEFSLVCSGTHTNLSELASETIDEVIDYHKKIGCDNIIVPWSDWSTPEKADKVIEQLNIASEKLAQNGIRLGYHNHSKEFFPNAYGTVFEDELINRTNIELEIDTFWLFNAGKDVIEFLEQNKNRIRVIHLKDGIPTSSEPRNIDNIGEGVQGLSVGLGKAPITKVREWANKNNVLMVVESEGLDPTGLQEVGRCIEFLRTLD